MGSLSTAPSRPEPSGDGDSVWSSRARAVLERVRRVEAAERRAMLDRECGDDWALHAEVAGLLAHELRATRVGGSLDDSDPARPHPSDAPTATSEALRADSIPGYRLGEVIGVGGAGVVYDAEQERPRRRVALKVFRSPRTDAHLRRRIAHEAEILARLQHPSIAQVFAVHAGSNGDSDVPWIAMERVEGVPIDVWCRTRATSLTTRVELLAAIAEAIAHAHASGVVHRDLKPTNVLVTSDGLPKVVDFGVARALHDAPAVGTLHTRDGDLIGTLAYMAPEQVEGASSLVDARTDVHALGTLAFETIAGRRPRDPEWMTLPEWANTLRTPPPSLATVVPGTPTDLSIIVAKALAPEREGRYPTAQAFADDLRRFLRDEPILARAPTTGYLLRSFVRRHRTLVAALAAVVVALATGLAASLRFAVDANRQRERADQESHDAHREAYRAQLSVATEAIRNGNAFAARAALDRTPEELRGWEWRHLDGRIDRAMRRVAWDEPFEGEVFPSADRRFVAGRRRGGGALVVDATSGAVLRRIATEPRIEMLALLADGSRLVVARAGGRLEVVQVATGVVSPLGEGDAWTEPCDRLATSVSGAIVVESRPGRHPRLRIFDLDAGTIRTRDVESNWGFSSLRLDKSGSLLVAGVGDGRVLAMDLDRERPEREVANFAAVQRELAFVPGTRRFLSVTNDRRAALVDADGKLPEQFVSLHQQRVTSAAADESGSLLATWAGERVLRVFRASDQLLLASIPAIDADEESSLRFTADGGGIELLDTTGRRTWSVAQDTELDVLRGHRSTTEGNRYPYVYDVVFSPDGRRLATGGWDGTVRVWNVATGRPLAVLEAPGSVHSVGWSPDGATIVAVGRPGHVTSFDAATGRRLATSNVGHEWMAGGVAWSRDGREAIVAIGRVGVFRREPRTLAEHGPALIERFDAWSVAAGRGGEIFAGDSTGHLRRIDADGRSILFPDRPCAVMGIAVSPDGSLVASVGENSETVIHESRTGAVRRTLRSHVGRGYAVAFSPDGRRIATGGDDGTVRLHDAATGDELLVLRGHASYVYRIAFSPDGETIASASGDNTARLWTTRPVAGRVSRRDVELALEAAVESRVDELLAAAANPDEAISAIRADARFSADARAAALDVALRRLTAAPRPPAK